MTILSHSRFSIADSSDKRNVSFPHHLGKIAPGIIDLSVPTPWVGFVSPLIRVAAGASGRFGSHQVFPKRQQAVVADSLFERDVFNQETFLAAPGPFFANRTGLWSSTRKLDDVVHGCPRVGHSNGIDSLHDVSVHRSMSGARIGDGCP